MKKALVCFGVFVGFSMFAGVVLAMQLNKKSQEIEIRNQEQKIASAKNVFCGSEKEFSLKGGGLKMVSYTCSDVSVIK